MSMHGADVIRLRRLADQLESSGHAVAHAYELTVRALRDPAWFGPDAEMFQSLWTGAVRVRIGEVEQLLRGAAVCLRAQATEQERASAAQGSLMGLTIPPWLRGPAEWLKERISEENERRRLGAELDAHLSKSPAEQLAWWNALSPDERALLIASFPATVLLLQGLPDADRQRASERVVEGMLEDIPIEEGSWKLEAGVNVKIVKIEGGLEAAVTRYADGHYEVRIDGDVAAGLGLSADAAKLSLVEGREYGVTFTFASEAEMMEFMKGLAMAPLPDDGWEALTAGNSGHVQKEIAEYLYNNREHIKSATITGQMSGSVEIEVPGVGKVELERATGITLDLRSGETTLYLNTTADGTIAGGGGAATGQIEGGVQVTLNRDGTLNDLIIEGHVRGGVGAGMLSEVDFTATGGAEGRVHIKVDLQSAQVHQASMDLINAISSGDAGAVADAVKRLHDASTVTVQTSAVVETRAGVDAKVAEIGYTQTGTSATSTHVKPPNGTYVSVASGGPGGWGGR